MKTGFCLLFIFHLLYASQVMAASDLKVVVTIKPFHSLVAAVMQGVSKPVLLFNGNTSPHSYSLRPSEAEKLQKAELIFWSGEKLEGFLAKPLKSLASKAKLISFQNIYGLQHWPLRSGIDWQSTEPDSEHSTLHLSEEKTATHSDTDPHNSEHSTVHLSEEKTAHHSDTDPHIWLDPRNADIITQYIVEILSETDPENTAIYQSNGNNIRLRLKKLDQELLEKMAAVSKKAYLVFHDAYQYFEKRYQLNSLTSVTLGIGHSTSVQRMMELQQKIKNNNIICIFTEPQFSPKLVQTVIAGSSVKKGILDPLGSKIPPGPELYFSLLNNLGHSIRMCLN